MHFFLGALRVKIYSAVVLYVFGNNRLFAYCKDDNFNIHIWAWFRLFHLLNKGNQVLFKFGEELISCLGHANVRAFHKNPNRIHTEVTVFEP